MKIVIVESNTPDRNAEAATHGIATMAQSYAAALHSLDERLTLVTAAPFSTGVNTHDFDTADGVVFTGSSVTFGADSAEAAPLRAALEICFGLGVPVFGSCNGLHVATAVLGGRLGPSPKGMELGLAQGLRATDRGRRHPMMADRQTTYVAPCIHRDEVQDLPQGAVILAENDHSPVQAMSYSHGGVQFWGTQYHPELTLFDVRRILETRDGLFDQGTHLVADLRRLEAGEAAFGTTLAAQTGAARMPELVAWLNHVRIGAQGLSPVTTMR